jgi:ETC complex I subunit conserved region
LHANPDLRQSDRMSHARIYQKPKNAMQSGRSGTDRWLLEFQPAEAKRPDPLTGWAGSGDTRGQISLSFPTLDAAKAYADKYGIKAAIIPAPQKVLKLQAYADNFR